MAHSFSVLTELRNVRQRPEGLRRRWFHSKDEDLIVWYSRTGAIAGFQLCYDCNFRERALTWKAGKGFTHERVDDGEGDGLAHKRTPILVPDGALDTHALRARFDAIARRLPREVATFVHEKLRGLPDPFISRG